jgi:hypothetical protein
MSQGNTSKNFAFQRWDGLYHPAKNLSLNMSTFTTTHTWATGTSTNNLLTLTTDASANGTGALLFVGTGNSSTVVPLLVKSGATTALTVNASAQVLVNSLTSGRVTYAGTNGLLQDSANMTFDGNRLSLATTGNTGGLLIGGDANLYRNAANELATDDTLNVGVALNVISNITTSGGYLISGEGGGGLTGAVQLLGDTSGVVTIRPQDTAGTYNFNLPTTAGTSGHVLTSGGGGFTAMTWTDPASLGVRWNSIANPNGNQSLTMSTHTTTWNWATGTSTNNLFSLTTDASANGTGVLLNVATGASSTVVPFRVRRDTTDYLTVNATGGVLIGNLTSGRVTYAGTSGLLQDSANMTFDGNRLSLVTTGSSGGLLIGGDANLYRSAADTLRTDDSLVVSTNLTVSTMTIGSILFAGTSGLVSQDNTNLFWDDTNNTFGIGATRTGAISSTNPSARIVGTGATSATSSFEVQTNAAATILFVRNDSRIGIGTNSPSFDLSLGGAVARTIGVNRRGTGTGHNLTVQAGGAQVGGTDLSGGTLILSSGISTGLGPGYVDIYAINTYGLTSGTTDRNAVFHARFGEGKFGIGTSTLTYDITLASIISEAPYTYVIGVQTATANNGHSLNLQAGNVTTTADLNGGNLILTAGNSTGSGSSSISFYTATAGGSGTTVRTSSLKMTLTGAGQLQISTTGSSAGILIGGDALLYRSAADTLRTPDSLVIDTNLTVSGTASIGAVGGTTGTINLLGSTSGTVSVLVQATAGTYNFNLPTTAGTSGHILTSGGGGGTAMTWTDPAELGVRWNALINPNGNESLSMSTFTTTWNWATGTGTNNLLSLTTDASANGTGVLLNVATGTSSTVVPFRVRRDTTDYLTVNATGGVLIGNLTSGRVTYAGTSGLLQDSANMTFDGNRLSLATTGSSGGLLIGGDANLYRSAADVLATDDHFNLITSNREIRLSTSSGYNGGLLFNSNMRLSAHSASGFVFAPFTYTHTSSSNQVIFMDVTYSPASASSGSLYGTSVGVTYNDDDTVGNFTGEIIGSYNRAAFNTNAAGSHTFNRGIAVKGYLSTYDDNIGSGAIVVNAYGGWFEIEDTSTTRITNAYGLYSFLNTPYTDNNQTRYGLYVGAMPSPGSYTGTTTAAIRLAGTGGSRDGILFGSDTNIYRSAANTLKTDDSFEIGTNLSVLNAGTFSLYESGSGNFSSFVAGTQANDLRYTLPTSQPSTNQVLTATAISGSGPYDITLGWAAPAASISIGSSVTSGTAGSILFVGSGPILAQDNPNLFWDDANNYLGVGTSATPASRLHIAGNQTASAWTTNGILLRIGTATLTDSSSSGTVAASVANSIQTPTFAASSSTTYTDAATLYIAANPTAGTNVTITNGYALWVDSGATRLDGNLTIGTLTSGRVPFASTGGLLIDSSNFTYTTGSGQLALATSGSGAGLLIGGDAQIYRDAADILRTPDSVRIDTAVGINTTAPATTAGRLSVVGSFTALSGSNQNIVSNITHTVNSPDSSSGRVWGLNFSVTATGSGTFSDATGTTGVEGLSTYSGSGTAGGCVGIIAYARNTGSGTLTRATGISILSATNTGGGHITNLRSADLNWALDFSAINQSRCALRIGAGPTNSGSFSGSIVGGIYFNSDSGGAQDGIIWGTTGDTNLYRSAANTLKTDDALIVVSNLTVNTLTSGRVPFASTSGLFVDSANFTYTTGTGQLALATSGSGAGLLIGGDAQIYRTSADVLRTPDSLQVDSFVGINSTPATTNRLLAAHTTSTNVNGRTIQSTNDITGNITSAFPSAGYFQATPNAGANGISYVAGLVGSVRAQSGQSGTVTEQYGIDFDNWHSGSANITTMTGAKSFVSLRNTSSGTVSSMSGYTVTLDAQSGGTNSAVTAAYGFDFGASLSGASTVTALTGLRIQNPSGSQTITTFYGIRLADLTRGGTNYGIYFDGTSGLSRQGIWWNADTNLYRSAADTLRTDDAFVSGSTITGASSLTLGANGGTIGTILLRGNTSGTVTITPAAAAGTWSLTLPTSGGTDGQVLKTNGSGTTSWVNPGVPWTEVTGTSQSAAAHNGYITNNAALVTVTLPTPAVGSVIEIVGSGAGGWRAQCATSHTIRMGTTVSASTGYAQSTNQYDCIKIVGISTTAWLIVSAVGTIDIT